MEPIVGAFSKVKCNTMFRHCMLTFNKCTMDHLKTTIFTDQVSDWQQASLPLQRYK